MKNLIKTSAASILMLLLVLMQAQASPKYTPTAFKVEVTGKGKPVILIPGLSCSGEVWKETIDRYKKDHQLHVLTLAGFAGQPAIKTDNFLETVRLDLAKYIRENNIKKPMIIGHSLGGYLGIWLSAKEPDLVSSLVVVDAAPFLPALISPVATPETMKPMAAQMRQSILSQTPEQLRQSQPQVLKMMISDEARIAQALEWNLASDAPTVAQAMYELYTQDLRPEMASIKAPAMFVAAWVAYKDYGTTHETTKANYTAQLAKLPSYELVINDKAKHFIMWDDQEGFFAALDGFMAKTGK
ncbi:alpha/beta fold hydrolase [Pontibacter rugosus]|uniref:Alpha/beta fold hydrolase n=1 Tax=Pontibacter rugosus TaxID=1745966 RepID=A0ABW3SUQ3_9BACT